MNNVNKTLYIPLYGKAYVSARNYFIRDEKAEAIWAAEGFALKGKSGSKWLAYYMGIRCAVFDRWVKEQLDQFPEAAVIHIGCGLDSRVIRVGTMAHKWYDLDFPEVIAERKRYYEESAQYKMLPADVREGGWLASVPESQCAIVVMEGVSMYLAPRELERLIQNLCGHFKQLVLLMDCYTTKAAKLSKYRNPVNDVGVTEVYGMDDPEALCSGSFAFVQEYPMTPREYVDQLKGCDKFIFQKLYAGRLAKGLYRLYGYRKGFVP